MSEELENNVNEEEEFDNTIVLDDEEGNELDYDIPGEIKATSKLITKGYYNKPEATAKILGNVTEDGKTELMTGDYGYIDDNGEVYIIGRMNDAIELSNGERIQSCPLFSEGISSVGTCVEV